MTQSRWSVAGLLLATFPALPRGGSRRRSRSTTTIYWPPSPSPLSRPTAIASPTPCRATTRRATRARSDLWSVPWSGGKPAQLTRTPRPASRSRASRRTASRCFSSAMPARTRTRRRPSCGACPRKAAGRGRSRTFRAASAISTSRPMAGARWWWPRSAARRQQGRDTAADRDRPLPVQMGRRRLPRRSHAATLHRRPRHRQGEAIHPGPARSLASRVVARRLVHRVHREGSRRHRPRLQLRSVRAAASTPASREDQHLRRARTTIRTGARALPGRRIRAACCGWKVARDKWIYYATAHLAVADLATGEVTRPARIDRWFYFPKFAPDGSIVALIEQDRDTWLARIDRRAATSTT